MTVPSSVASGATIRTSRAPTITRENTSRPSWSVPNQCAPDGAWLIAFRFWAYGLCGTSVGPNTAQKTQNSRITAPTRNVFECSELAQQFVAVLPPAAAERAG